MIITHERERERERDRQHHRFGGGGGCEFHSKETQQVFVVTIKMYMEDVQMYRVGEGGGVMFALGLGGTLLFA